MNLSELKYKVPTEGAVTVKDRKSIWRIIEELRRRRIIRGSFQDDIVYKLLERGAVYGSAYRHIGGRASRYVTRYQESIDALMERLKDAGFKIRYQEGPLGGAWSGTYILEGLPSWAEEIAKGYGESTMKRKKSNTNLAETVLKLNRAIRRLFIEQTVSDLGVTPQVPADDDLPVEPEVDTYELETDMSSEVYRDLYQDLVDAIRERGNLEVELVDGGIAIGSEDGYAIVKFVVLNGEPLVQWQLPSGVYSFTLAPQIGTVDNVEDVISKLISDDHIDDFISMIRSGFEAGEIELEVGEEEGEDLFDEIPEEEPPLEEEPPFEEEPGGEEELPPEDFEAGEFPPPGEGEEEFPPEGEEERPEERPEEEPEEEEEEEEEAAGESHRSRRRFSLKKRLKEQAPSADPDELTKRVLRSFDFPNFYKKFEPREGQPDIISYVSTSANTERESDESIT